MAKIECRGVSVFLLKPTGNQVTVLLMRRVGDVLPGEWCQVAGKIENGETAWQAALREVREETGIELTDLWSADCVEQFYEPAKDTINVIPVFVGRVPEDTTVTLNDEHDAYEWVSFSKARTLLSFTQQKNALASVKADFVDMSPNPHLKIRFLN